MTSPRTSPEWSAPVRVAEINTTGWEDGAYIDANNKTIYFTYINIDLFKLPAQVVSGPTRDSGLCAPVCGNFPRPDVFFSTRDDNGKWQKPIPHPLTIKFPVGGIVFSSKNKAYFNQEKNQENKTELYYAERINKEWQAPVSLTALNSDYKDSDPHVMPNDEEIFFWSDRPANYKGDNIYYSKKVNQKWGKPVLLPGPINSNSNDMQPFVHGKYLYFSSDREGKMKIFRTAFSDGKWSEPSIVIESSVAVGEPTLTKDGRYLYFIQIFKADNNAFNPEVMRVEMIK